MVTRHVWLIAGLAFTAACTDTLGLGTTGRWAAPGIELQASNTAIDLRMPCVPSFRASRPLIRPADRIEFGGRVSNLWYSYDFTFRGRFAGDTLFATLIRSASGADTSVSTYQMTRDGDSGLGRIVCLA